MKKMLFLMLFLTILGTVNVRSQVRIGNNTAPEKGAVLDLNSASYKGGLLLPNVNITDLEKIPASFTDTGVQDQDTNEALTGMIVWNTNTTTGVGICWWDGTKWNRLNSAAPCTAPATPGAMTLSATTVDLNGTFTASVTAVSGATSYVWTLPTGLTGTSTTSTITITGATANTYAAGSIQVAAKNDCGTSATSNSTAAVTVTSCSAAPAIPGAISLSETTVNLNGTFTASITAVPGATSYVWNLPTGLTGSSTTNTITITGSTANTYAAGSITVAAKNDCGTSATSNSTSAVTVKNCSAPPATPGAITLSATTINQGETFTASITAVSGATSYVWNLPDGLTGTSSTYTITITGAVANTYSAGTIRVASSNACGISDQSAESPAVTVQQNSPYKLSTGCSYSAKQNCTCETGYSTRWRISATQAEVDSPQVRLLFDNGHSWFIWSSNGDQPVMYFNGSAWVNDNSNYGYALCYR